MCRAAPSRLGAAARVARRAVAGLVGVLLATSQAGAAASPNVAPPRVEVGPAAARPTFSNAAAVGPAPAAGEPRASAEGEPALAGGGGQPPPAAAATNDAAPLGEPVHWDPGWQRFEARHWGATGAALAVLAVTKLGPQRRQKAFGPVLYDEAVRDVLRSDSRVGRRWARDLSDIGLILNTAWTYFDAVVISDWYRDSPDVGWQQGLITAETLMITSAVQGTVNWLVARERPYGEGCAGPAESTTRDCRTRNRYWSFFSGHSAQSFAAAGVNCLHHRKVPLYGGGAAEDWSCVAGFGMALSTALFRVVTDVHYATDVTTGALVGTALGLGLPYLLHYRESSGGRQGSAGAGSQPAKSHFLVAPQGLGLSALWIF